MVVIAGFLVGLLSGGLTAHRRGGNRTDILHYASIFGLVGALLGLFATLFLGRMLL